MRRKIKIVTSHIYPPIPSRAFDWCAYFDGMEETGPYGYGWTEAVAIQDLLDNAEDYWDASTDRDA